MAGETAPAVPWYKVLSQPDTQTSYYQVLDPARKVRGSPSEGPGARGDGEEPGQEERLEDHPADCADVARLVRAERRDNFCLFSGSDQLLSGGGSLNCPLRER